MVHSAYCMQVFIHDFKCLADQGGTGSPNCADLSSISQGLLRISGGGESDEVDSDVSMHMHRLAMKPSELGLS